MQKLTLIFHCIVSLVLLIIITSSSACTTYEYFDTDSSRQQYPRRSDQTVDPSDRSMTGSRTQRMRMPWEVWEYGKDLKEMPIQDATILQGDQYFEYGNTEEALAFYRQARNKAISENEKTALTMRIASAELVMDRPKTALSVISQYFKSQGSDAEDVNAELSLALAYAYGRVGDVDQAFAWFSRVNRLVGERSKTGAGAVVGARLLVRTIPTQKLKASQNTWLSDSMLSTIIDHELKMRETPGYRAEDANKPFWGTKEQSVSNLEKNLPDLMGAHRIAVLLPLSGQYAQLGRSVKNGIEMAVVKDGGSAVAVDYKDIGNDSYLAKSNFYDIQKEGGYDLVLGPLLAEQVVSVAELAKGGKLPIIAFSKNDNFLTGDGVYRLGATADGQVASLLEAVYERLNLQKYALIYPENANGQLFSQVFKRKINDMGLRIEYEASYQQGDSNKLSEIAGKLAEQDIDAIFIPDTIDATAIFYAAVPEPVRKRVRLLGTAAWDNVNKILNSRALFEGLIYPSPYFVNSTRPMIGQFNSDYSSQYKITPDFLAAQGYDAAVIAIKTFKIMTKYDMSFDQAIGNMDVYDGLTGAIAADSYGELRRRYDVIELKNGKLIELKTSISH